MFDAICTLPFSIVRASSQTEQATSTGHRACDQHMIALKRPMSDMTLRCIQPGPSEDLDGKPEPDQGPFMFNVYLYIYIHTYIHIHIRIRTHIHIYVCIAYMYKYTWLMH